MDMEHLRVEPFTTTSAGRPAAPARARTAHRGGRRRRAIKTETIIKIGVCAGALLMVLFFELFLRGKQAASVETGGGAPAASTPEDGEGTEEDALGRLQYVSGRFHSVYTGAKQWKLPFTGTDMELLDHDKVLKITAEPGEAVRAAADGQVRRVGKHATYGDFVQVYHGDDVESIYYHLSDICVETGQPLSADDTLGLVPEDGTLYVCILRGGSTQQVFQYFAQPGSS